MQSGRLLEISFGSAIPKWMPLTEWEEKVIRNVMIPGKAEL